MNTLIEQRLRNYFFALVKRKSAIEEEIRHELMRPLPCTLTLQRLKRQRLQLKDRIRLADFQRQRGMSIKRTIDLNRERLPMPFRKQSLSKELVDHAPVQEHSRGLS